MAKVSIIVPVYNVEPYLPRCIDSILSQTLEGWELILIDDGSPDHCGEIIDRYAKQGPRIVAVHQENKGVSAARNAGLMRATGDYVSFVDPDDYVSETFLEKLVAAMDEGADIACCNWCAFTDDQEFPHPVETIPYIMDREQWMIHLFDSPRTVGGSNWNKMFRRSMIQNTYDEALRICEDNVFLCQYSMGIQRAAYINEMLYYVYERSDSATRKDRSALVDSLPARRRIIEIVSTADRSVRELAEKDFLDTCLTYYKDLSIDNPEKSRKSREFLKLYLWRNILTVLTNPKIYWKTKLLYLIC